MSYDVVALIIGTVLAIGALAYVLYPLFVDAPEPMAVPAAAPERRRDDSAIVALREIEFDRATGKLSESDYLELRGQYAPRALAELRGSEAATPAVGESFEDLIEARVRAYRDARLSCGTCGLRPEPDAVYCSTCGSFLPGACPHCGAQVGERAAGFCSSCGGALGAAVTV